MSSPSPTVIMFLMSFAMDVTFFEVLVLCAWSLEAWRTSKSSRSSSQHDLNDFSGDYKSFSFNTEDANHNWKNMDENFASQCKCQKIRKYIYKKNVNIFSTSKLNTLAQKKNEHGSSLRLASALTSLFARVGPRWWNSRSWSLPFLSRARWPLASRVKFEIILESSL